MEQVEQMKTDDSAPITDSTVSPSRTNSDKTRVIQHRRVTDVVAYRPVENNPLVESHPTRANTHACKAYQRGYVQARDRLKRADRDLGETVAVIAASLTTVTAVEAVINIAHDKIGLPRQFLLATFDAYIATFIVILLWGAFRSIKAIHRRTRAEGDVDQAKKGMFEFCPGEQWPKEEA